jgi:hypothetical protein
MLRMIIRSIVEAARGLDNEQFSYAVSFRHQLERQVSP